MCVCVYVRACACTRWRHRGRNGARGLTCQQSPESRFPLAESNQAAADACSRGIAPLQPSGLIRSHVCCEEGCRSRVTTRHALTCVRTCVCVCVRTLCNELPARYDDKGGHEEVVQDDTTHLQRLHLLPARTPGV